VINSINIKNSSCPLCSLLCADTGFASTQKPADIHYYARDKKREYYQCNRCSLVFVPPSFHLSSEQEKAEYDLHQNRVEDKAYQGFLNRLLKPLLSLFQQSDYAQLATSKPEQVQCLDFGCGPGPALAMLLRQQGYSVNIYDKFYAEDKSVISETFKCRYTLITMTEVAEHLDRPDEIWRLLDSLLAPGGHLGVMTKLVQSPEAFSKWHYKNDPTHISFYTKETLLFIAEQLNLDFQQVDKDAFVFIKPSKHQINT